MGNKKKIFTPTIVILSLVSLFNDISSEMLLPVLPIYLSSIGFSVLYIGILEGFAEAVVGLSKGYFGQRSDETGNRVSFVRIGYGLSAVAKPMLGLLVFPFWVFVSRTLDRLGKGIRTNARDALLADESLHEHRGKVFGFHRSLDTIGAAVGPAIALGYLFLFPAQYQNLFLLAFIPGAAAVLLAFKLKNKSTQAKERKPFRFFSYFAYWKESSPQYKKVVPAFLLFALFNSSDAFLILIGKHNGLSDSTIILAYIFFNVVYASLAFPMGKLADKYGMKFSYSIGLAAFITAYALMPFASTTVLFFSAFLIYGIFAASTEGISKAWITTICTPHTKATALGFYSSFQSIVALAASSLAGLLWVKLNAQAVFFVSASGALVVLVYVLSFLYEKKKTATEAAV